MTDSLGPQFLFHGTAMNVEGNQILPAKVHGKGSYWNDVGSSRGEPANAHAWAHPDEGTAWKFAMDRVVHTSLENDWNPRARVYAVHPNAQQSSGGDSSIPGEVKAPHFDIEKRVDTMPGRQGTFPEVNWNNHVLHTGVFAEDEDANHPRDDSAQYGHRNTKWGTHWNGPMMKAAHDEDLERTMARENAVQGPYKHNHFEAGKDDPLPGMMNERQFNPRMGQR